MIGCKTCNVGIYYGLQVSGYYTAYCRSARLGLNDKLSYKTRSVRLKGSEKYPDWCPEKNNIVKEVKIIEYKKSN